MTATVVQVSRGWRVDRARIVAPVDADPADLSTFVRQVMRSAVEAGQAGGPAVAEGVMTRPRLGEASLHEVEGGGKR